MHRFYAPELSFDRLDRAVELPEDEARHLARVMRLKPGDDIAVFDGRGHEALARVEAIAGRRVTVTPIEPRTPAPEPAVALTLAQAVLKGDKMDRVIRDAVMLGAATIQPFVATRTDVPREALRKGGRRHHWENTALASVKQCGRAVVPPVLPVCDFSALLGGLGDAMCLMFVEPGADRGSETFDGKAVSADYDALRSLETRVPAKAAILIGPEGGWEPAELTAAVAAGVTPVTFGRRTLRADAVAAAAMAVLQYVWKL